MKEKVGKKVGKKTSGKRPVIKAENMPQYLFDKLEDMYYRQEEVNALLHKRLLKALKGDGSDVEDAFTQFSQGLDWALSIVSHQTGMIKDWNG